MAEEQTGGARLWHQAASKIRQPLSGLANFLAGTYDDGEHFEAKGQHARTSRNLTRLFNRAGMRPQEAAMLTRGAGIFNEQVPAALQALSGSVGFLTGEKDPKGWRDMYGPSGYDDADLDENEAGIAEAIGEGDQRNPLAAIALEIARNPVGVAIKTPWLVADALRDDDDGGLFGE